MPNTRLEIADGPDRSELLKSLANPGRQVIVHFCTPDGAFAAVIDQMEPSPRAGGNGLTLEGRIRSGVHDGLYFAGTYDSDKKTGRLAIHIASDAAPVL